MSVFFRSLLLIVCAAFGALAQGDVREGLTLPSRILGHPIRYTIYLPPGYEASKRTYPVVYLFHNAQEDDTAWIHQGEAAQTLERGIASRELVPMIVVMPDGGTSGFINSADGSVRWEDAFLQEVIPFIESRFRVRPHRMARALAGHASGGRGALTLAFKHPNLFRACVALSPALHDAEALAALSEDQWAQDHAGVYGAGLQGAARATDHWRAHSPLALAEQIPPRQLGSLRIYLDCGDRDPLLPGSLALHQLLRSRGLVHDLRVRSGDHRWSTWRVGLHPALAYLSGVFRQE